MYHTIDFNAPLTVDVEISPRDRLERLVVRRGTRLKAQVRPYVLESEDGPVEVADLFFEDGRTARAVSFNWFAFVD